MHNATLDLQLGMRKMKRAYRDYYILKMDIRKYFNSIDKRILYKILKRRIKDEKLLWLIRQVLTAQKRQKGIEIGNYTSQTFANIYLNELDQYATRKLKVPFYYRYMDDIVILFKTKKDAKEALDKIKKFLKEHLELELNDKTNIFRGKQGVNFCGYKINENISSKDARIYLTGHLGYFNIANTYTLKKKNILLQDELLREKIIY